MSCEVEAPLQISIPLRENIHGITLLVFIFPRRLSFSYGAVFGSPKHRF